MDIDHRVDTSRDDLRIYSEAAGLVSVSKAFTAGDTADKDRSVLRERLRAAFTTRRAQYDDLLTDVRPSKRQTFIAGVDTGLEEALRIVEEVLNGTSEDSNIRT